MGPMPAFTFVWVFIVVSPLGRVLVFEERLAQSTLPGPCAWSRRNGTPRHRPTPRTPASHRTPKRANQPGLPAKHLCNPHFRGLQSRVISLSLPPRGGPPRLRAEHGGAAAADPPPVGE